MIYANEEFLEHIEDRKILCATITHGSVWVKMQTHTFNLPRNYTKEQFDQFLINLTFNYNEVSGHQELFGTIWYTDGTWSDRDEYDGSEWWEHNQIPEIPDYL